MSKGYGTTLQLGTLSFRNSAATSALGLPTSLGLQEKLYLNYHSWTKSRCYNFKHKNGHIEFIVREYLEKIFFLIICDEQSFNTKCQPLLMFQIKYLQRLTTLYLSENVNGLPPTPHPP